MVLSEKCVRQHPELYATQTNNRPTFPIQKCERNLTLPVGLAGPWTNLWPFVDFKDLNILSSSLAVLRPREGTGMSDSRFAILGSLHSTERMPRDQASLNCLNVRASGTFVDLSNRLLDK